jgi:hypothetical protein
MRFGLGLHKYEYKRPFFICIEFSIQNESVGLHWI